jgi:demethylmenaquinone methyltransferase/2-methoxy-6-polyprenyl-1,4-benzoquinol methylase
MGGDVNLRNNSFAQQLFRGLPARYDLLAEVLSAGQNRRWRRTMVNHVVQHQPERILDVATGTCGVAVQLAQQTGGRIAALDLTESMLVTGRSNVSTRGLSNQIFAVRGRAEELPFPADYFDALTFTYLLRYVKSPPLTLAELARVVRPGGIMASIEFFVPSALLLRLGWRIYTHVVLPPLAWVAGGHDWYRVGRFLGPSISSHYRRYPLEWTMDAWGRAGLVDVGARTMSLGSGLIMWGTKSNG